MERNDLIDYEAYVDGKWVPVKITLSGAARLRDYLDSQLKERGHLPPQEFQEDRLRLLVD